MIGIIPVDGGMKVMSRSAHEKNFIIKLVRNITLTGVNALMLSIYAIGFIGSSCAAEELVWATGRVMDTRGNPLIGATVAAYDDSNRVMDYARTDRYGEYALALPKHALHIEHKRGKGFIAEVFTGVTRFVGGAAGFVANPLRAGVHAVTNSQAANFTDPITKGGIAAGGIVVDQLLFAVTPREKRKAPVEERKKPGALLIKVIARDKNDLVGVGTVYWLQEESFHTRGRENKTLAAWLDPIRMTPADSEMPSKFESEYLRFTSTRLDPSIAERGETIRVSARLLLPPDPAINPVVVARNSKTGEKWELKLDNDGYYAAEITIDKRFPLNDQMISVLAYAANERKPGRRQDAERAIEGAGLWDVSKPYIYDPLLVVSRSRADLLLTIVNPSKRHH